MSEYAGVVKTQLAELPISVSDLLILRWGAVICISKLPSDANIAGPGNTLRTTMRLSQLIRLSCCNSFGKVALAEVALTAYRFNVLQKELDPIHYYILFITQFRDINIWDEPEYSWKMFTFKEWQWWTLKENSLCYRSGIRNLRKWVWV